MGAQLRKDITDWAKAAGPDVSHPLFFRNCYKQHTALDFLFWHTRRKEHFCIQKHPKGPVRVEPFSLWKDVMKSLRSNDVRVGETVRCRLRNHEWQDRDLLREVRIQRKEREGYMLDNRELYLELYLRQLDD
jgi:hypothetical protein